MSSAARAPSKPLPARAGQQANRERPAGSPGTCALRNLSEYPPAPRARTDARYRPTRGDGDPARPQLRLWRFQVCQAQTHANLQVSEFAAQPQSPANLFRDTRANFSKAWHPVALPQLNWHMLPISGKVDRSSPGMSRRFGRRFGRTQHAARNSATGTVLGQVRVRVRTC